MAGLFWHFPNFPSSTYLGRGGGGPAPPRGRLRLSTGPLVARPGWLASRQQAMMIALLGLPLGLLLQPRLAHRHARRADVRMGTETSTAYGAEQVRARLQRIPACPIVAWKL